MRSTEVPPVCVLCRVYGTPGNAGASIPHSRLNLLPRWFVANVFWVPTQAPISPGKRPKLENDSEGRVTDRTNGVCLHGFFLLLVFAHIFGGQCGTDNTLNRGVPPLLVTL